MALAALAAVPAAAETFDLHVRRYCKPATFCGYATLADYDQRICTAVQELNLIWTVTGFSFRPQIFAVDSTSPSDGVRRPAGHSKYYQVTGCADDASFDSLRKHWVDNVAKKNTSALSLNLTKGWNRCCSGIPRTFKNLDNAHGYFCDAHPNRGDFGTGSVWSHETGHHWSLGHTHGACADSADGEDPTGDADAGVPKACSAKDAKGEPLGCNGDQDCQNAGLGTCSDSDKLPPVTDTPADRCGFEACKKVCQVDDKGCSADADCAANKGPCICKAGADENFDGDLIDGHTWFASTSSERELVPVTTNVSRGSPHPTRCLAEIKQRTSGTTSGSDTVPASEVTVRNTMSYHPGDCLGPYVVFGKRREAFTADQLARIAECRTQIFPRDAAHLPDVCANRGHDTDHDGICDLDDDCPHDANTCQLDSDGDGEGDACDLCPNDPTPTGDIDGDGIGDACDTDRDGDGCLNDADDHPDEGQQPTITKLYVGCPSESETAYVSDGFDTDGDGLPNCQDPDDDNDGLCDAAGPDCQSVGDPCPEVAGVCIMPAAGQPCPPIWAVCNLGCVEYFLKLVDAINPDPTRELVFDRLWMVNRALFTAHLPGQTAAEGLDAIGGIAGAAIAAAGGPGARLGGSVAVELWQRLPDGSERRVTVIGRYAASELRLGDLTRGGFLRLFPTEGATRAPMLDADTTSGIGLLPGEGMDSDGDGEPDAQDDCVATPNPGQQDADGDGFGNACDADLDQDGVVDDDDVARVRDCAGAALTAEVPLLEPAGFDGEVFGTAPPEPTRLAAALAAACRDADLDGDGDVDATDAEFAAAMLGRAPGPSAVDRGLRPKATAARMPACADAVPLAPARLLMTRLDRPPGQQGVALEGQLVFSAPIAPPLDPMSKGLGLLLRDGSGKTLLEARIPGGLYDRKIRAGWTGKRRTARYRSRAGVAGINEVALRWNAKGRVKIVVSGKRARLVRGPTLPLFWQLDLEGSRAATMQCGETDFLPAPERPSCTTKRGGSVVACGYGRGRAKE